MAQERRIDRTPELWAELAGRTMIVTGPDEGGRQEFAQNLAHLAGLQRTELPVADRLEAAAAEDFVIFFAGMPQADTTGQQEAIASDVHGASHPGQGYAAALSEMLDSLEALSNADFTAAVVVTDYRVFGKCFGRERALREEELGYVCHTSTAEQPQFGMRLAEQLACRMARENGVNIKVVRVPCELQLGDAQKKLIEEVLSVLLYGEAGEVYSLPDLQAASAAGEASAAPKSQGDRAASAAEHRDWQEMPATDGQRSALSPIRIRPDTRKLEELMKNGRFNRYYGTMTVAEEK